MVRGLLILAVLCCFNAVAEPDCGSGYQQYAAECLSPKTESAKEKFKASYAALFRRTINEDKFRISNGREPRFEEQLRKAQAAWEISTELNCAFYAESLTTSSWAGIHAQECINNAYEERAGQLDRIFAG